MRIWTDRFDAVFGQRLRFAKNAIAFFGLKRIDDQRQAAYDKAEARKDAAYAKAEELKNKVFIKWEALQKEADIRVATAKQKAGC